MDNFQKLRKEALEWARRDLKEKRFIHTLGVESAAIALARVHGESEEKASIAAILHDIAKYVPDEQSLNILKNTDIIREFPEIVEYPQLYHPFVGAELIRQRFPDMPEEIIQAVRYHTTGRPDMSRLEKIIFSADYIEPGRNIFPGLSTAREQLFANLDKGVLLIFEQTDAYLKKGDPEAQYFPLTKQAFDFMKALVKETEM